MDICHSASLLLLLPNFRQPSLRVYSRKPGVKSRKFWKWFQKGQDAFYTEKKNLNNSNNAVKSEIYTCSFDPFPNFVLILPLLHQAAKLAAA